MVGRRGTVYSLLDIVCQELIRSFNAVATGQWERNGSFSLRLTGIKVFATLILFDILFTHRHTERAYSQKR